MPSIDTKVLKEYLEREKYSIKVSDFDGGIYRSIINVANLDKFIDENSKKDTPVEKEYVYDGLCAFCREEGKGCGCCGEIKPKTKGE